MKKNLNDNVDEIDLKKLFDALWEGKNTVVSLTLALSIIAVIVSLSLPNVYQSEAILSPVVSEGATNQSMQNIGGLQALQVLT